MPRNETLEALHTAFNELSPDGASKTRLRKARAEMERDLASDKAIMLMIASAIVDGLKFGNW